MKKEILVQEKNIIQIKQKDFLVYQSKLVNKKDKI